MKSNSSQRCLTALAACLSLLAGTSLHAQQQFQGLCSRVKIAIQQELTVERIGFEATNHYLYTLNDLAEKVLNCDSLLRSCVCRIPTDLSRG